jgi:6-pyruvoyltetrahydropterin/6-carboxytetrahydropterin synthase
MVLDFSFLKEEMMNQIHNPCDHACILAYNDPMLMSIFDPSILVTIVDGVRAHGSVQIVSEFWKVYVIEGPPTAEVLAEHWFHRLQDRIDIRSEGRARLDAIRVHETPNCSAVFAPRRPKAYKKVDPTELVHAEDLGLKEESVS